MEIGTKIAKPTLKFRVWFAIGTALTYLFTLWLFDYFSEEKYYSIKSLVFQGLCYGVFFGIGFPYINTWLSQKFSKAIGAKIIPVLELEEEIEIEGPANLFRGIEGIGGKIFLTNKRIIFKSHRANIQRGQISIEYKKVKKITKRKTAKFLDNGIKIKTNNGSEFNFVVNERKQWIKKLTERIGQ